MKNKLFLYILIFVLPVLVCFSCFTSHGFCQSLTLDANAIGILTNDGQSGATLGAYNEFAEYGINADPNYIVFGATSILDDINTKLYENYGWDLETMSWEVEDAFTQSVKDDVVSKLALGATIGEGFALYESTLVNQLTGAKDYILGKIDNVTGKISDVFNNAYVYVSDNVISKLNNVKALLKNANTIIDNTSAISSYGKSFSYSYNTDSYKYDYNIVLNKPCITVATSLMNIQGDVKPYYLYLIYPSGTNPVLNAGNMTRTNLSDNTVSTTQIRSRTMHQVGNFVVNGVTYNYFYLDLIGYSFNAQTAVANRFSSLESVQNYIATYDPFHTTKAISYDVDNYRTLLSLLNQIKGTYVTTNDLAIISDKLDALQITDNVIGDTVVPTLDLDDSFIQDLALTLSQILTRNLAINDAIAIDTPIYPDTDYNEQGISIPVDFNNDIIDNTMSVFKLPFSFIDIFKPLFYLFGSFNGMFAIFAFIPLIIIGILIIWALK